MESISLQDVPLSASREAAGHLPIGDADRYLVLAVECVEMGGLMILVEHGDHDTQEAAELRHGRKLRPNAVSSGPCTDTGARRPGLWLPSRALHGRRLGGRRTMCPVLKLDPHAPSEDQELEFELAYQGGLTTPSGSR